VNIEFVIVTELASMIPSERPEPVPVAVLPENIEFVIVVAPDWTMSAPDDVAVAVFDVTVEFEIVNGSRCASTAPPPAAAPVAFPPDSVKLSSTNAPLLVECTTRAPAVPWCTVTPLPSTLSDELPALNRSSPLVKVIVPNPGVTVIVFVASALALASMNA
jgi:hypothetical protein